MSRAASTTGAASPTIGGLEVEAVSAPQTNELATLDFSCLDQVNGPIAVDGAAPGDTLQGVAPADDAQLSLVLGLGPGLGEERCRDG